GLRRAGVRALSTFFFSSRRRHTRFSRDWSSDVCSSDLSKKNQRTPPARGAKWWAKSPTVGRISRGASHYETLGTKSDPRMGSFCRTSPVDTPAVAHDALDGTRRPLAVGSLPAPSTRLALGPRSPRGRSRTRRLQCTSRSLRENSDTLGGMFRPVANFTIAPLVHTFAPSGRWVPCSPRLRTWPSGRASRRPPFPGLLLITPGSAGRRKSGSG